MISATVQKQNSDDAIILYGGQKGENEQQREQRQRVIKQAFFGAIMHKLKGKKLKVLRKHEAKFPLKTHGIFFIRFSIW